jgi:hypothetical protein
MSAPPRLDNWAKPHSGNNLSLGCSTYFTLTKGALNNAFVILIWAAWAHLIWSKARAGAKMSESFQVVDRLSMAK